MSNFKVWIDDPIIGTNTFDSNDFANTSLSRGVGFVAGTAASSKWVNSALRQANLVAAAFMDALGSNADGLDLNSSVELVKTRIQNYLNSLSNVAFTQASTRSNLTSGDSLSAQLGKISKWFADLKDMAFLTSVGTNKIDNNAVTTAKIADNSIINSKIASNTIDKSKLVTGIINDYDTSKGTIEQRLTNLGFKSGRITTASVISSTYLSNNIERQGNFARILFEWTRSNSSDYISVPRNSNGKYLLKIGTIPDNFLPLSDNVMWILCSNATLVSSEGSTKYVQAEPVKMYITGNELWADFQLVPRSQAGICAEIKVESITSFFTGDVYAGYEANPL